MAFDVDWRVRWLDWVRPGIEVLHSKGVRAGMLLTIAGPGTSDAGAVASLRANIQATEELATARSRHRRLLDAVPSPQLARVGLRHLDVGLGLVPFPTRAWRPLKFSRKSAGFAMFGCMPRALETPAYKIIATTTPYSATLPLSSLDCEPDVREQWYINATVAPNCYIRRIGT